MGVNTMTDRPSLLVAAHGFVRERESTYPAREHVWRLRGTDAFDDVCAGLVNGEPGIESQVHSIDGGRLVVVPLFMSDGYFVGTVVPDHVESACPEDVTVEYAEPVGTHPRITDVIMRSALSALDGNSEEVGIALFGHGSEHSTHNSDAIREHARRIRNLGPFPEVRSYFVEEEPTGEELPTDFSAPEVIGIPVFVADGSHVREDIPDQVGFSGRGGTVAGTDITYAPPVGTDPLVAGIVFERALGTLDGGVDGQLTDTTATFQEGRQKQ